MYWQQILEIVSPGVTESGPFEILDVTDGEKMHQLAKDFKADTMIHMAALLSATAEAKPLLAWNLNMGGLSECTRSFSRIRYAIFYSKFNWSIWSFYT